MQIFNFLNCRKVNESGLNLFENLSLKQAFFIIAALGLQVFVIHKGGSIWGVYPNGLIFVQWVICLGLSLCVIVVGILVKQIPDDEER